MSTFRSDLVAGVTTMMNAFIVANPTVVVRHFRHRPPTLTTDLPCTYLDLRPESISHANGLRDRVMSPSVVYVGRWTEAGEVMDGFDDAVDLLVDHFSTYPHIVAGTIWDELTVADESVEDHPAVRFTFGNIAIAEGRD